MNRIFEKIVSLVFKFKSLKRSQLEILAAFLSAVVVMMSFQNCSDVKVSDLPSTPPVEPPVNPLAKPEGELCAPKGAVFGAPVRIVIILDMSASNVGSINAWTDANNMAHWSIDTGDGPTDLTGQRFDQIKNFILNCGSSANVKYSIFGFSRRAQFARGQSCLSPFESQADAVRTVDAFKAQQAADVARRSGTGPYPFNLGNETNYTTATTCLAQKIQEDLTLLSEERPVYHTFFLTDGQPTEDDPGLAGILTGQLANINLATMNYASGFHFQGIYYTSPGAKNDGAQQATALSLLTTLTRVTEGPSANAINIQNISTTQAELCSKLQPNAQVDYNLKSIYAINLTAMMQKNNLAADSDLDGVSDADEISLGWDPTNYRSTGIFDGVCKLTLNDKVKCQTAAAALTCSPSSFNFGLSDCDRVFVAQKFGRQLLSPDIDRDSVPNLIELIRGSAMARADMLDNPTADGINNFQKISKGMDIAASTDNWPIDPKKLVDLNFDATEGSCANGLDKISYRIDQIPFVEVKAYADPTDDVTVNFSHAENENVVLVFSVWQSNGGLALPNRLYVQKWLVPKTTDAKKEEVKFLGEF